MLKKLIAAVQSMRSAQNRYWKMHQSGHPPIYILRQQEKVKEAEANVDALINQYDAAVAKKETGI